MGDAGAAGYGRFGTGLVSRRQLLKRGGLIGGGLLAAQLGSSFVAPASASAALSETRRATYAKVVGAIAQTPDCRGVDPALVQAAPTNFAEIYASMGEDVQAFVDTVLDRLESDSAFSAGSPTERLERLRTWLNTRTALAGGAARAYLDAALAAIDCAARPLFPGTDGSHPALVRI